MKSTILGKVLLVNNLKEQAKCNGTSQTSYQGRNYEFSKLQTTFLFVLPIRIVYF